MWKLPVIKFVKNSNGELVLVEHPPLMLTDDEMKAHMASPLRKLVTNLLTSEKSKNFDKSVLSKEINPPNFDDL